MRGETTGARGAAGRVLLYSHDTYGLGHLRRSLTIAGALVEQGAAASCLIVTGSPLAERFRFPEGVAFERIPAVVKTSDGGYRPLHGGEEIEGVVERRRAALAAAERRYAPDLMIVDKEPWGLRGELGPALAQASARGCRIVLGLRDVLDEEDALVREWERKNALEAIETYYDEIWVYGVPEMHAPLAGLGLSERMADRVVYTGYLRRGPRPAPAGSTPAPAPWPGGAPGLLVTTGGGGDGAALVDWVLSAYEADAGLGPAALVVYGPFLDAGLREGFDARVARLPGRVSALGFHPGLEGMLAGAAGVVAMGGYNTFCEILSMDRPAIIVPRVRPRREQWIRAAAAERLGLLTMLTPERDGGGPEVMARAIRGLAARPAPSAVAPPGLMCGLGRVAERAAAMLDRPAVAVGG